MLTWLCSPRNGLLLGKRNFCSKMREKDVWSSKKIPLYFVASHPVGITWTSLCHCEIKARKRLQKSDFENGMDSREMFSELDRPSGGRAGLGWMFGDFSGNPMLYLFVNSEQKNISPIHFLILVLFLRETGGKGERWCFYVVPKLLSENNCPALNLSVHRAWLVLM